MNENDEIIQSQEDEALETPVGEDPLPVTDGEQLPELGDEIIAEEKADTIAEDTEPAEHAVEALAQETGKEASPAPVDTKDEIAQPTINISLNKPENETADAQQEETEAPATVEKVENPTLVFTPPAAEKPQFTGIELACRLCDTVLAKVGKDGFHGGVRPDNISIYEGEVSLGNPLEHGVGEFTPQELEYMSPELFWDGNRSHSADIYSLGLVLYAIYNHGMLPFWPVEGESSPSVRATALQQRMNHEEITPPAAAGSELSAIILRALAFNPDDRWSDMEEFSHALSHCEEEQTMASDIAVVLRGMIQRENQDTTPAETSSPFLSEPSLAEEKNDLHDMEEENIPKVKVRRNTGRLSQVLVYIALAFAIVAIILLLRRCVALDEEARVTPTPPVATIKEPSPDEKIISGNLSVGDDETQTGEDTPPTEDTPAPETEPTVTPTPEPVGKVEYMVVRENVSWSQAVQRCEELGGQLAMPTSYEEFQAITAKCEEQGLAFAWLNARRNAEGKWVNNKDEEGNFFFAWGDGEPSGHDASDGVTEDYFLLWNKNGRWTGNDSRANPLADYFQIFGGQIGFVCEKVTYETVNITDIGG